jgi:hypothetical protein
MSVARFVSCGVWNGRPADVYKVMATMRWQCKAWRMWSAISMVLLLLMLVFLKLPSGGAVTIDVIDARA